MLILPELEKTLLIHECFSLPPLSSIIRIYFQVVFLGAVVCAIHKRLRGKSNEKYTQDVIKKQRKYRRD